MKKIILVSVLTMIIMGCSTTSNKPEYIPPTPSTEVSECIHKYSPKLNFEYVRVKTYIQKLFGNTITTHEFTLPNDSKRFLSDDEIVNYSCSLV